MAQTLFYKPFPPLELPGSSSKSAQLSSIERSIQQKHWSAARAQSGKLVRSALLGLRYLDTYERTLIRIMAVFAYAGWAAYASLYIFRPLDKPRAPASSRVPTTTAFLILLSFWMAFAVQKSPWTYYLYVAFPCYFWLQFFVQARPTLLVSSKNPENYVQLFLRCGLVFAALQAMVVCLYSHFIFLSKRIMLYRQPTSTGPSGVQAF